MSNIATNQQKTYSFTQMNDLSKPYYKVSKLAKLTCKSQLHKIITNQDNSPDYLAINIYWDSLCSWSKQSKGCNGVLRGYKDLCSSHGSNRETIRRKLIKLERLGLIHRMFGHQMNNSDFTYNQLIIYVWKDTSYFINNRGIAKSEINHLIANTNYTNSVNKDSLTVTSSVLGGDHA